eukprot:TRINITY_DN2941_c0_g2_i1.p1 TRINITY_DN2941_c0_g2~~TRINITY_DN2941_c0_g2_i1.p1  ORF type:complete len:258 (+),score=52.17 TRINITY_DN2941_c0_g2_i1:275-1048(+)
MGNESAHSKEGGTAREEESRWPFQWGTVSPDLHLLVRRLVAFRNRRRTLFQRTDFIKGENLTWHGFLPHQPQWDNPDSNFLALSMREDDNSSPSSSSEAALGLPAPAEASLIAQPAGPGGEVAREVADVFLALNAHSYPVTVQLPGPPTDMTWFRILDTDLPPDAISVYGEPLLLLDAELAADTVPRGPGSAFGLPAVEEYVMQPFSMLLLEAQRLPPSASAPSVPAPVEAVAAPEPAPATAPQSFSAPRKRPLPRL